jgi:phytanoyl-CoA dioxygenase PhyH
MTTAIHDAAEPGVGFSLSPQQLLYFRTFGFLRLPGLFKPDVDRLIDGFEEAFATRPPDKVITVDQLQETDNPAFTDRKRTILYHIVEKSEKLRWLAGDPRVVGIVNAIVGPHHEARPTDGHIFNCDTSWHPDMGSDDRFRLKLSFYLDPQHADSGAIRLIPGSHFHDGPYAKLLLEHLYGSAQKIRGSYGVDPDDVPCWTIETEPGDLLCWNFRTFHATFHGFNRRRLFSMTYAEARSA